MLCFSLGYAAFALGALAGGKRLCRPEGDVDDFEVRVAEVLGGGKAGMVFRGGEAFATTIIKSLLGTRGQG